MEILILVCLVIIIVLLLDSKINQKYYPSQKHPSMRKKIYNEDIIGVTKTNYSHSETNEALERQISKSFLNSPTFEMKTDKNISDFEEKESGLDGNADIEISAEEEEAIWSNDYSKDEIGFTTGVTLDELSTVGAILQNEELEPALEKKAVDIVRKIQGTELLSLLEEQIEGASKRIALLLDKSINESATSSPPLSKNDINDFDIGQFV